MKLSHRSHSPVEILESRITPAGNLLAQVIGGHLIVTGDAAANAFEITETEGGTETAVAYLLTPLDASTTINGSAAPLTITGVAGDVRIALGAGNDVLRVGGTTEFATMRTIRDLKIDGGAGDNTIDLSGVIRRNLVITNGAGNDHIDATRGLVAEGNVSISNGPGSSTTRIGGGFGTGNLSISNGSGAEFIAEVEATINGSLIIQAAKVTAARITVGASEIQEDETSQVFRDLHIVTGGGNDEIAVTNVGHINRGSIFTGGGSDFVLIDDVDFSKDFTLFTGAGADVVKIDTRPGSGLSTLFDGSVRTSLGGGDDVLRLGVAGSVITRVEVFLSNRWDGGTGKDRVDAANVFTFSAEPSFVRFDSYGAPPLFDDPVFYDVGNYDLGTELTDLVSADLNGDGILDLATTDRELQQVHLLFGKGDGTFAPGGSFDTGPARYGLAVGDFDGKNGLDLVVANGVATTISLLLNDGTGKFAPPVTFGVGREIAPIDVVVADYNGDAKLDVATLNISGYQDTSISILLGGADGTFTFLQEYELKPGPVGELEDYFGAPNDIALGDINGDGKLDLAATGLRGFGVLLGNGDGTFRTHVERRDVASGLDLGDTNGDGKLDLVIDSGGLHLQLGNGDGTFGSPTLISAHATGDPTVADLNNDGFLDVATTRSEFHGDLLEVLLGNGDGTFKGPLDFQMGDEAGAIAIGDFNRDGFRDLAVANSYAARIALLLNRGHR